MRYLSSALLALSSVRNPAPIYLPSFVRAPHRFFVLLKYTVPEPEGLILAGGNSPFSLYLSRACSASSFVMNVVPTYFPSDERARHFWDCLSSVTVPEPPSLCVIFVTPVSLYRIIPCSASSFVSNVPIPTPHTVARHLPLYVCSIVPEPRGLILRGGNSPFSLYLFRA